MFAMCRRGEEKRKKMRDKRLQVHDVRGDGSCFFRSVAASLLLRRRDSATATSSSSSSSDEDELVRALRRMTASLARHYYRQKTLDMISEALRACFCQPRVDCYLDRTPFDRVSKDATLDANVDAYANAIETTNLFVSFVEVELMKLFLSKRNVGLVVVSSLNESDLRMQLRNVREKRVLILINHGGSHYDRVTLDGMTLPPRGGFTPTPPTEGLGAPGPACLQSI